jgi:hypothetical protein
MFTPPSSSLLLLFFSCCLFFVLSFFRPMYGSRGLFQILLCYLILHIFHFFRLYLKSVTAAQLRTSRQWLYFVVPGITANPNRMSRQALTVVARLNWSERNKTKTVCHQSEESDTITGSLDGNSGQYNHHTITPTV